MVIKASSSKEIEALVGDLSSASAVKRDAAIARLTVIGARAVERLIHIAANSNSGSIARIAAFRALEGIGEARTLAPAVAALNDPDPMVAIAGLNTARSFLAAEQGMTALDRVIEIALDRRRTVAVRVVAIQALTALPGATVRAILAALKDDPDPEIANVLQPAPRRAAVNPLQRLEAAAAGSLPADPAVLKSAISRSAADPQPATLHQIIERVRVREGSEPAERRAAWVAVRAAVHLALAQRGSRLALYDLRETIESARERIPVEFFAAVSSIGDTTCLEPLALAYSQAKDDWSQRHLVDAFKAIVKRENITRRHAAAKRIEKRWPGRWATFTN